MRLPTGCCSVKSSAVTALTISSPCRPIRSGSMGRAAGTVGALSHTTTSTARVLMRSSTRTGPGAYLQAFRERIRMEAAERFAVGASNVEVAKNLRVSVRSVQRWRRAWHDAGAEGLRSAGPVSLPKLSEPLFAVLEQELAKGPVAHGWPDQTWTLARIKTLIGRRFHK